MNLKKCTCGKMLTTKTIKSLGRHSMGDGSPEMLYFNCNDCHSTLVLIDGNKSRAELITGGKAGSPVNNLLRRIS